jgi:hypothetical protein
VHWIGKILGTQALAKDHVIMRLFQRSAILQKNTRKARFKPGTKQ